MAETRLTRFYSQEQLKVKFDESRRFILKFMEDKECVSISDLVPVMDLTKAQIQSQLRKLQSTGHIVMKWINNNSKSCRYYLTGKPYEISEDIPEQAKNPYARTVRLLDRKPEKLSDAERKARRKAAQTIRGSTMTMFEGW